MRPTQEIRKGNNSSKIVFILGILFVGLIMFIQAIAIVGPGERGVLLTWGAVDDRVLDEGLHWKMPIAQSVFNMDVKTQRYTNTETSASKDLQDVQTEITLNFHIDPVEANTIFQTLSPEYGQRVIVPAVSEAVKAVTAEFDAEELITKRPLVRSQIEKVIVEKLTKFNVIVDQVSITNFAFSDQFDAAIESKQVAEQEALKAENILKRIEVEKLQAITAAEGQAGARLAVAKAEAEAIAIQGKALRDNPEILQLRQLEKWNGVLPRVLTTGGSDIPIILDLGTSTQGE